MFKKDSKMRKLPRNSMTISMRERINRTRISTNPWKKKNRTVTQSWRINGRPGSYSKPRDTAADCRPEKKLNMAFHKFSIDSRTLSFACDQL